MANGSGAIYGALAELRRRHPGLRLIDQVYDADAGWINEYRPAVAGALDAVIGCNRRICEAYRAAGCPPQRVVEIPHPLDGDRFDPARYPAARRRALKRELGLPPDQRVVSFLSRLHPQKRPLDFVELARLFAGDVATVFLMVGEGPLADAVDAALARCRLANLVRRPFHARSAELLAISDVVVLPSEHEGMPLVVLESLAMGVPVVATDVGNTRELLARTGGGRVVDRIGQPRLLRAAVRALLEAPPCPVKMRREVLERYRVELVAAQYHAVLAGTAGAPGPTSQSAG